jgi:dinuclear metal center YbgI/SA1388 family protein
VITIGHITAIMERFAPLPLQEDYDNSGLLTGDKNREARAVLVTLDVTKDVVLEAIHKGCNMIVAHHPFIFSGLKKVTGANDVEQTLILAIKHDIAIYAAHTNIDAAKNGLNKRFADKLGLIRQQVLSPVKNMLVKLVTFVPVEHAQKVRSAIFDAGAGHIGNYDCCSYSVSGEGTFRANSEANPFVGDLNSLHAEPELRIETILPEFLSNRVVEAMVKAHPYEEVAYDLYPLKNSWREQGIGRVGELPEPEDELLFLNRVKKIFGVEVIRHTQFLGLPVKKVAVCGGAGAFMINDAIRAQADVFLTGDIKYHEFFKAEKRIVLADIGHFESEQYVKEIFEELIHKNFPNFAVRLSEINTNPIKYL